jgi:hypothetical protein
MADDDSYPIEPALDAVFVLMAELHREGVLGGRNITNMARRLEMAELPDLAARVAMLPLCNEIDEPGAIRAHLSLVPDGGNGDGE